jgi:hypothetical protein
MTTVTHKPHGGGYAATAPLPRRAGYGAAPPASRVTDAIAMRRPAAALDPGDLYGPLAGTHRGQAQGPAPPARGATHNPRSTKFKSLRFTRKWLQAARSRVTR